MQKFIPYGRQHITDEDVDEVVRVLRSDFLTQGPEIARFEEAFAEFIGCKHAIAVSNGTAALHLSVLALGLQPGDKVITSPVTFAASANCIRYAGGEVVFCDIDPDTFLLDPNEVKRLLESHPKGTFKGIIPVDLTGMPVEHEAIRKLADEHGLWVLEDSCHAPGAQFMDSKGELQTCGNGVYADLAIFSFHPVKHIACGEGGMITTNRDDLAKTLQLIRTHGITKDPDLLTDNHGGWYYEQVDLGYNYRLTDVQAALGTSQVKRAQEGLDRRQEIATRYDEAFAEVDAVELQQDTTGLVRHAYHLYVIRVDDRKGLYDHLRSHQIGVQIHYIPLHLMPYYQKLGWQQGDFPQAEEYYSRCISLPMYPTLTNEEQDFVIEQILKYVQSER